MDNPFYLSGLNFSCKQCSHCCRKEPGFVYLSKKDLTNLLACFNLSAEVFINKYCRWVPYYDGSEVLALLEKDNYDCILWDKGCISYQYRPVQCRTYPFWSFLLADKQTWDEQAIDCPGINNGLLHDFAEIKKAKDEYELNFPVRRRDLSEAEYEN